MHFLSYILFGLPPQNISKRRQFKKYRDTPPLLKRGEDIGY